MLNCKLSKNLGFKVVGISKAKGAPTVFPSLDNGETGIVSIDYNIQKYKDQIRDAVAKFDPVVNFALGVYDKLRFPCVKFNCRETEGLIVMPISPRSINVSFY